MTEKKEDKVKYGFAMCTNGHVHAREVRPAPTLLATIPTGVYETVVVGEDGENGLKLVNIPEMPARIYGDVHKNVSRYFSSFERLKGNLGVFLVGQKGSGKTLTMKVLIKHAIASDMPVILVKSYTGPALYTLLESIEQEVLVVCDEFDKTFFSTKDSEADFSRQKGLLDIMDGLTAGGRKMFVLSGNDADAISPYMRRRPSRIRYTTVFEMLPLSVLLEYSKANLKNCTDQAIVDMMRCRAMYGDGMNFDMLAAIVQEMNLYGDSAYQAAQTMFGIVNPRSGLNFLAEVTLPVPEGTVYKVGAKEEIHRNELVMVVYEVPGEEKDEILHHQLEIDLQELSLVCISEDAKTHEYKWGEVKLKLRVLDHDSSVRDKAFIGDLAQDVDYAEYKAVRDTMRDRLTKHRPVDEPLAVQFKPEHMGAQRGGLGVYGVFAQPGSPYVSSMSNLSQKHLPAGGERSHLWNPGEFGPNGNLASEEP